MSESTRYDSEWLNFCFLLKYLPPFIFSFRRPHTTPVLVLLYAVWVAFRSGLTCWTDTRDNFSLSLRLAPLLLLADV